MLQINNNLKFKYSRSLFEKIFLVTKAQRGSSGNNSAMNFFTYLDVAIFLEIRKNPSVINCISVSYLLEFSFSILNIEFINSFLALDEYQMCTKYPISFGEGITLF